MTICWVPGTPDTTTDVHFVYFLGARTQGKHFTQTLPCTPLHESLWLATPPRCHYHKLFKDEVIKMQRVPVPPSRSSSQTHLTEYPSGLTPRPATGRGLTHSAHSLQETQGYFRIFVWLPSPRVTHFKTFLYFITRCSSKAHSSSTS